MAGGPRWVRLQETVLIDATTKSISAFSYLASRSEKTFSRPEALLKDAEMKKNRVPNTVASILDRNAIFMQFSLSAKRSSRPCG